MSKIKKAILGITVVVACMGSVTYANAANAGGKVCIKVEIDKVEIEYCIEV